VYLINKAILNKNLIGLLYPASDLVVQGLSSMFLVLQLALLCSSFIFEIIPTNATIKCYLY